MRTRTKIVGLATIAITTLALFIYMNTETAGSRKDICRFLDDRAVRIKIDHGDARSLIEIIDVLNGNWSFARTHAAVTLGDLGDKAKPAIPDLIRALDCGDHFVEREAAIALGKVSRGMPDAVDALSKKLSSDWDVSIFSAEALGEIGAPAVVALPLLRELAANPGYRPELGEMASNAIRKLERLRREPM
jgi:hypothetical protein